MGSGCATTGCDLNDHVSVESYDGWRLGVQMWSFKKFTLFEGIDKTASLGLSTIEMYSGQVVSKETSTETTHYTMSADIAEKIVKADATGYVRANLEFHRTLYLRAQSPAMLALVETVWLQSGPTMRSLYSRRPQKQASEKHRSILAALRNHDEPALRAAIASDVTSGLRMLLT